MMEIVNGVACFNCTDVDRAKKNGGEDPKATKAGGPGDVNATSISAEIDLDEAAERSRIDEGRKSRKAPNENQPLAFAERGRALNIQARQSVPRPLNFQVKSGHWKEAIRL